MKNLKWVMEKVRKDEIAGRGLTQDQVNSLQGIVAGNPMGNIAKVILDTLHMKFHDLTPTDKNPLKVDPRILHDLKKDILAVERLVKEIG
jgi:hypothetical protein